MKVSFGAGHVLLPFLWPSTGRQTYAPLFQRLFCQSKSFSFPHGSDGSGQKKRLQKVITIINPTDYGRPERKSPSLKIHSHFQIFRYGQSILCLPNFQISLIYAFIGCPQPVINPISPLTVTKSTSSNTQNIESVQYLGTV